MWHEHLDNETRRMLLAFEKPYRAVTKHVNADEYLVTFTQSDFEELAEFINVD
jgi:hypothetical protein